ncbi:dihydrolipoamide dehydrogenase [Maledivibacter halophilus]|uniref:Dihydrolipoyl dehydrogenase n=2 Tax=Maledivibacter halophilus TaxID=36842 RepID=A0A1T5MI26_9FIRM|nr:dihydrolipoamide dehydrogenase [Maledivibacter halophilus]
MAMEIIMPKTKSNKDQNGKNEYYDVIVIGGGPAGYVAAIKAAQLNGKVALIEKDVVGGTCLNRGCVPTKTYLRNAEIIETIKYSNNRGIILKNSNIEIDMNKVVDEKNKVVETLTTGVMGLLKSYGVTTYNGVGKITKDKRVIINASKIIDGKKIILAGGSKTAKINIQGIESPLVLTSSEILDLKEIPKSLAIIGGGVIGVELATVFSSYGSEVTIIEMQDRIVPLMDKDISLELFNNLKSKGINIFTSSGVKRIEENNNKLIIYLHNNEIIKTDKALLSIGRVPDLDGIGDVSFQMERGKIQVNEYMETSINGIYAPGDINGLNMLAHAAFKMGEIAASNAMGGSEKINLANVPGCIYTLPEVGCVGLSEDEARKKYDISIGRFNFGSNGRALASGEIKGFVKVIVDRKYGEILGVHIIGPSAAEIINEAAALMEMEITINEVVKIIHGHPTFSEAFMEACGDALGCSIHLPKKQL